MLNRFGLLALTVVALAGSDARAQITTSSSGCPIGPNVLVAVGNFSIGAQTVLSVVPIACTTAPVVLMLGTPMVAPVTLPAAAACPPGPCVMSCSPLITILGPYPFLPVSVTVPNDPTLVGTLSFCMQAACPSDNAGATCVVMGDRTDVTVQ